MSFLDGLFQKLVSVGGVLQTDRGTLDFLGATARQDASNNTLRLVVGNTSTGAVKAVNVTAAYGEHVRTGAGCTTVNLPTAAGHTDEKVTVTCTDGTDVVIDPAGSETMSGNATITLTAAYESLTIQSDGTNWVIVARVGAGGS